MTAPVGSIFLHYFDPHFLDEVARARPRDEVAREARTATRLAVIAADEVYIPAASYVENVICRQIVNELRPLWASGQLSIVGGEATLEDYALSKLLQYVPGTPRHASYAAIRSGFAETPPYRSRRGSATEDLIRWWRERGDDFGAVIDGIPTELVTGFDRRWMAVPDQLGGLAFTPEYVLPLLVGDDATPAEALVAARGRSFINSDYFRSYTDELEAGLMTDLVYLASNAAVPRYAVSVPYKQLTIQLQARGVLNEVLTASPQRLVELREDQRVAAAVIETAHVPPELELTTQLVLPLTRLRPALDALLATRAGRKDAHRYSKRVKVVLETMFPLSLGAGHQEFEINEGRKRIDLVFPNIARRGAFLWAKQRFNARFVIVECKNYKEDPANPEIDQLLGRCGSGLGSFGLLLCRTLKNFDLAMARCTDVARDHGHLLVPLADRDLADLAELATDPGTAAMDANALTKRMLAVARGV